MRTHWPPRRSARRARPQAAEPSGGCARSPACRARARPALSGPHSHSAGLRSRGPRLGSLPRVHAAAAATWAHHGGNARRVPARRRPPEPQRRLSAVCPQSPGPCPSPAGPARPLRPQLSMAQPPSLDHAQKLSQVDFLRVSLLWSPLREARVSVPVGGERQPRVEAAGGASSRGSLRGRVDLSGYGGYGACGAGLGVGPLPQPRREAAGPPARRVLRRGIETGAGGASGARGRPPPGSRVAASVPGAYFHLFGLQAPGVGHAFPPPGCAGHRARTERSPTGGRAGTGGGGRRAAGEAGWAGGAHPTASAQARHPARPSVSIHHPDVLKLP